MLRVKCIEAAVLPLFIYAVDGTFFIIIASTFELTMRQSVFVSHSQSYKRILIKCSGNVDNGPTHFGDVLESIGTLTSNLLKIIPQDHSQLTLKKNNLLLCNLVLLLPKHCILHEYSTLC